MGATASYAATKLSQDAHAAQCARVAEDERLALLQDQGGARARGLVLHGVPLAVVVDGAVLEDLHERRARVLVGALQDVLQVPGVHVHGARHEGGARAERERDGVHRVVHRPLR